MKEATLKENLEHLQWAQQIAIFSYFVEPSKKLGLQSARYPARHFTSSPSPSTNVASVFSLSRSVFYSGSSDTSSKNPASQHPAHSLISSILFQTLLPLLRFPHLIRSTIASTFRLRFSPVSFFFFFVKYFLESDLYFFAFSFNFGFSLFWVWIACLNLFLEFFVWITFIFTVFLLKAKKIMFLLFCVHSLRGRVHEALYVLCFNSLD